MIWNASPPPSPRDSPLSLVESPVNALSMIYTLLLTSYTEITREMYKFDHYLEFLLYPTTSTHHTILFLQDIFPTMFLDYQQATASLRDSENLSLPAGASIICFPLFPKPHEVSDSVPWVKKWWDGEDG